MTSHDHEHDHNHDCCHDNDADTDAIELPVPGLIRPRRLRRIGPLRNAVAEVHLHPDMLCQPHFVLPGKSRREEITSMPGIVRESVDNLVRTVRADLKLGIRHVLLFGLPQDKSPGGDGALDMDGPVPTAIRALKKAFGDDLLVSADICLCAYTDHGHCGVIEDGEVVNDETLPLLAGMASACAQAGADIVAPSDMMDGRVRAIRQALERNGFEDVAILSYAPSTPLRSTARSATPPNRPRPSATARPTRWTRPTPARRSAKSSWTSRRAPTWSWSSRP
jgi:delta-aminolevulinic acid dehydratase/porphobilinogen synthase